MSDVGEAVVQVVNDDLGFVHPGGLATFLNTQARDFDLAALLQQGLTVLLIVFRISQGHWHIQAAQGAARLDAKRARVELVQGQALGGLINLRLSGGRALFFAGAGQEIASDNQLTQAYAERFDKHSNSLMGKKEGPQLT